VKSIVRVLAKHPTGVASGLLLGWMALVFAVLPLMHMHPDEYLSYFHATDSLAHTVWYMARQDIHAPLWESFFWAWWRIGGTSEWVGRYQGVLWGMLTLSVAYRMVHTLTRSPYHGLWVVGLLGTNAYFITYTTEIRPYPLVIASASVACWTYWRFLHKPTPRRAVFYGASLALMGYVHYFLAFLWLAQAFHFVLTRPSRLALRHYGLALLVGGVIFAPWLEVFVRQAETSRRLSGEWGTAVSAFPTTWKTVSDYVRLLTSNAYWVVLPVLGWHMTRASNRAVRVFGVLAILASVLFWSANLPLRIYHPRYFAYLTVPFYVAVAVALGQFKRWGWGVWLLLVIWQTSQLTALIPQHTPRRDIYTAMNEASQLGDAVYFVMPDGNGGFDQWLIQQYLAPHLWANRVSTLEQAQAQRRVWLVTENWFDPHVQATFDQLEADHPLQHVAGDCHTRWCMLAQLLEAPPHSTPIATFRTPDGRDALGLLGVDVEAFQADQVTVQIWWEASAPLQRDYSISVRVWDANGNLLAQQDAPPLDQYRGRMETSTLPPNTFILDRRTLPLAPTSNPQGYQLELIVYHPLDGDILQVDGEEAWRMALERGGGALGTAP